MNEQKVCLDEYSDIVGSMNLILLDLLIPRFVVLVSASSVAFEAGASEVVFDNSVLTYPPETVLRIEPAKAFGDKFAKYRGPKDFFFFHKSIGFNASRAQNPRPKET